MRRGDELGSISLIISRRRDDRDYDTRNSSRPSEPLQDTPHITAESEELHTGCANHATRRCQLSQRARKRIEDSLRLNEKRRRHA